MLIGPVGDIARERADERLQWVIYQVPGRRNEPLHSHGFGSLASLIRRAHERLVYILEDFYSSTTRLLK